MIAWLERVQLIALDQLCGDGVVFFQATHEPGQTRPVGGAEVQDIAQQ